MKHKTIFVLLMIMVLVFLSTPMQAQETFQKFNLKLSLGYGNLMGGDLPDVTKGLNEMMADLSSLVGGMENFSLVENYVTASGKKLDRKDLALLQRY